MTASETLMAGASPTCGNTWSQIDWRHVEQQVRRLQMRIAKATQQGKHGKAKALQWMLTHSYFAKLLAIKRVTSNTGAKTPGVDGILWRTPKEKIQAIKSLQRKGYRVQPLRRIYIPKKNGKQRPLGIPTMKDRAMQALYLLALEPIAEVTADKHSYGFRPERSTADAIDQCFLALARKNSAQWILEGVLEGIRAIIKSNPTIKTESLIRLLNPKLRGWANYYRFVVSKAIFSKVDEAIFQALCRWTRRRHPHKNAKWLRDNYFCHPALKTWHFHARTRGADNRLILLKLAKISKIRITRHVKLRADATPYDSAFIPYLEKRRKQQLLLSKG